MKKKISNDEDLKFYYTICDIAKICKEYFYERKYLPNDCWSIDDVVNQILLSSKKLKDKYNEIKKTI